RPVLPQPRRRPRGGGAGQVAAVADSRIPRRLLGVRAKRALSTGLLAALAAAALLLPAAADAADSIYWSNLGFGSNDGSVRAGPLAGSSAGPAQDLFAGEGSPVGVALNPAAGKIYWANQTGGTIRAGNLDGSGSPSDLFSGGSADGVAVDPDA